MRSTGTPETCRTAAECRKRRGPPSSRRSEPVITGVVSSDVAVSSMAPVSTGCGLTSTKPVMPIFSSRRVVRSNSTLSRRLRNQYAASRLAPSSRSPVVAE